MFPRYALYDVKTGAIIGFHDNHISPPPKTPAPGTAVIGLTLAQYTQAVAEQNHTVVNGQIVSGAASKS